MFELSLPLISSIQNLGYVVIFLLMVVEGPIVTFAASIAAAAGYLDIWAILILSIFGNVIPDIALYLFGRLLRESGMEKVGRYFGVTKERIKSLEKRMKNHAIKTIILVKFIPGLPVLGLLLTGFMKINFKKFFLTSFIFNVVFSIIFVVLGFFSGMAASKVLEFFKIGQFIIPFALVMIVALYFILKAVFKKLRNI